MSLFNTPGRVVLARPEDAEPRQEKPVYTPIKTEAVNYMMQAAEDMPVKAFYYLYRLTEINPNLGA